MRRLELRALLLELPLLALQEHLPLAKLAVVRMQPRLASRRGGALGHGRGQGRGDVRGDVHARLRDAAERLREALLQDAARFLEVGDGARADALHGPLRRGGIPELVEVVRLEHRVVAEAQGVGVLLQHGELPGGEAEARGVLALPLGAVAQLVPQPPPVFLELLHLALELPVQGSELRGLHLGLELEVADVDVGVLRDAQLRPQEPRLLLEVLHLAP